MKSRNFLTLGIYLALFCLLALPVTLMADEYNQATKMTFNESVEVPGHVLPAGTYWFTLLNNSGDRNMVQIWNEDRTQLVATIFTIADYRSEPTGNTVINFEERPADQPEAIDAWFYPGALYGHEFVYPKSQALELSEQTQQPVLSMPDDSATDTAPTEPSAMQAVAADDEKMEVSQVIASEPTPAATSAATSEPPSDVVMARLPQTASLLPLWTLLGAVSMGAGLFFLRTGRQVASKAY
jgi:hypothetical protein